MQVAKISLRMSCPPCKTVDFDGNPCAGPSPEQTAEHGNPVQPLPFLGHESSPAFLLPPAKSKHCFRLSRRPSLLVHRKIR